MRVKRILAIAISLTMLLACNAYAAAQVSRTYTFTATDKAYESYTTEQIGKGELIDVETDITVDGSSYSAADISFKEVSKTEQNLKEKNYTGLTEKKVPESLTLKSGEKLKLIDCDFTENIREAATGTLTFQGSVARPNAPQTKDITVKLPNGESITVKGYLQSIDSSSRSGNEPFTVTAKFKGDRDVTMYRLGGVSIPNNPETPEFDGYENAILNYLGYDSTNYSIESGKWISDYITEDGQTVRYAEFSGYRVSSDWIATYAEDLTPNSPMYATYDATAKYGQEAYEIEATVTYEKKGLSQLQMMLIAGAGLIVLAGLVSVILFIIGKKKKQTS